MKWFVIFVILSSFLSGCSRENDIRDVQREESFGEDDFRDGDNYERTVPIEPDENPNP